MIWTKQRRSNSPSLASNLTFDEDWVSEPEQGRKDVFAGFVKRCEAKIELRWGRCQGRNATRIQPSDT